MPKGAKIWKRLNIGSCWYWKKCMFKWVILVVWRFGLNEQKKKKKIEDFCKTLEIVMFKDIVTNF